MPAAILPAIPVEDSLVDDFRGPWLRPQPNDVPSTEALQSINTEYDPHNVATRFAFTPFWHVNKAITSLYNWITSPNLVSTTGNTLVYYDQTDGVVYAQFNLINLVSPGPHALFSVSGAEGLSIAEYGNELIIATFKSIAGAGGPSPDGATACQILTIFPGTASLTVNPAFMGGVTTLPSLSNTGTGVVTAGIHSVGYVLTSDSGFMGPVDPVLGGDISSNPALVGQYNLFNTASNISAPGGQQIAVTANPPGGGWPAGCSSLQFVMSTAANPYEYFLIPDIGNNFSAPGGSSLPITYDINVSDAILLATGTDVTANQFLLTQDTLGHPPFKPFKVVEYGNRICYLTLDLLGTPAMYVSDPNNAEHITETFHKLRLPGFRQMMSAAALQTNLYIPGPDWTFSFQDTGGQPVTWPAPIVIDSTVGSNAVLGVVVSASNDWYATATDTGLYLFSGHYQDKPLSYMVDFDWRRINLNAAQTIRIANNRDKKQIILLVPLDGASTPNFLMCFDYTDGLDWQSIKYSLWSISGYQPRGIVVWQNPNTGRMETVVSSGTTGAILRQQNQTDDATPYLENNGSANVAMPQTWECAPQPAGSIGTIYAHIGGFVRAKGGNGATGTISSALLYATAYSLDHAKSATWARPIAMPNDTFGQEVWRQFYLTAERCSIAFTCGQQPGDFFILSGYRHRYYSWSTRR